MPQSLEDTLTNPPDAAEVPDVSTPETPPSQPSFSLPENISSRAQSAGLKFDGIDSHEKAYEYLLSQYEQTRPYADFGRSALAARPGQKDDEHDKRREPADEEPAVSEFDLDGHFSSLWSVPQLDAQAKFLVDSGIVQMGDEGLFEAKPGFEAMALPVLNALNQAHVAQRDQMKKLFDGNPYKNIHDGLWPALENRFRNMLDERLNRQFETYGQQQAAQTFEQQFIADNKAWLYGADGNTLTADGKKFVDTVAELRSKGLSDPTTLANYALKLAGINTQPQQQASGQPDGKQRDAQGRFLGAGTPPVTEPTKQESFLDAARRKAALSSSQGGYAGNEPVIGSDGELENLWTSEWKKHTAGAAA